MIVSTQKTSARTAQGARTRIYWLAAVFFATGLATGCFLLGLAFEKYLRPTLVSSTGATRPTAALYSLAQAPIRYVSSHFGPDVDVLHLDLKFKNLQKIHAKREEALGLGYLFSQKEDLVPAQIRLNGKTYRAEIRLKGDLPDHLEGDKWSFRIHIRDDDALLGMRRFSIQSPATRAFQSEPLFLETLRAEGILAPRYRFVRAVLNGRDMGLMALEEHFSKELLESQQHKSGVILKFDETNFWKNELLTGSHGPFDNYRLADIDVFRRSKMLETPELAANMNDAQSLLRSFVEGRLSASQAFDSELMGRFLATCEIWRAYHAVRWHNMRFYFNPYVRKLEPVGFDASLGARYVGPGLTVDQTPITKAILSDPAVRTAFVAALHRLSRSILDGTLQARLAPLERRTLKVLHREYPTRAPLDYDPLKMRAKALLDVYPDTLLGFGVLHGTDSKYASPLSIRMRQGADGISVIELRNNMPAQVEVRSLSFASPDQAPTGTDGPSASVDDRGKITKALTRDGISEASPTFAPNLPIRLPPTPAGAIPQVIQLKLVQPKAASGQLTGTAVIQGQSRIHRLTATQAPHSKGATRLPRTSVQSTLAAHPSLHLDSSGKWFVAAPGVHDVNSSMIIPPGYGLRVGAGTTLRLAKDAVIAVQGPVEMLGSEKSPVTLEPHTNPTGQSTWPGMVVLDSKDKSRLRHVTIRHTRGFELGSWVLTGGVTFYDSDVAFESCHFEDALGEDALNVVRSTFMLTNVTFSRTRSDAFDGDFSQGSISGGLFDQVGGDGIDFSGSTVTARGVTFKNIADKAVSVGEGSTLSGEGLQIELSGTGVVSKDRSTCTIVNTVLNRITHVPLMAYTKKQEFGPATLHATKTTIRNSSLQALAQLGSKVSLNGTQIESEKLDIDQLYSQGYMRK